ncbi:MAG TPA: hypothetical protein VFT56_16525 [Sphingomonas sp.]|nr:hypothetical protein [Sphingomonas sp.]
MIEMIEGASVDLDKDVATADVVLPHGVAQAVQRSLDTAAGTARRNGNARQRSQQQDQQRKPGT